MKRIILLLQLIVITTLLMTGCAPNTRRPPSFASQNTSSSAITSFNTNTQPQHIALLLPLSGSPLSPYANAIKDGFFEAYYYQKNHGGNTPAISVYNTSGQNIETVYQKAVSQGAQMVVGPLDKNDVLALAKSETTIPVLALNTTPSSVVINNSHLYEFGLSPTDEAQQAATYAFQNQKRNVIVLAPDSAFGQRVANSFISEWKNLNGTVVDVEYYGDIASLSRSVANALGITQANQNKRELESLLHENMRFIPERRQDFDSIFLVASPLMARQIQPLLQFYFAGNVPVYSTSEVYAGYPDPQHDHDLNGIYFCDMPWVLAPQKMPSTLSDIYVRIQTLWPNNYIRYQKFYAMGVDAYHLTATLNQMGAQQGVAGATGTLYLTPQHYIYRQLPWAQIQNGMPRVLS